MSEKFDITWRHGAYYVSIPKYTGGTVYTSEAYDRLTREHETLVKALEEIAGESGKKYPSSIPISVAKRALASLKEPAA
jgi:hypothetical protein